MSVKVMTYNIMHGLDCRLLKNKVRLIDLDGLSKIIKDEDPDIISLNEVYNDINHFETLEQVKYLGNLLGYKYYRFGKAITLNHDIEYGNGFLSKYEIKDCKVHKIKDAINHDEDVWYESRILMELDVIINEETIKVLVTHFGLAKEEQANACSLIKELIKEDKTKVILMGDFNITSDSIYYQEITKLFLDSSYLIKGCNYTFSSLDPNRKIDYIFVRNIDLISSHVVKKVHSDHYPLVLNIKL